jgi:hypothetical protein
LAFGFLFTVLSIDVMDKFGVFIIEKVIFDVKNETKRNETKRNETKRNETKRNETKRNETKQSEKF